ncbi:hypothetical protein M595_5197 [Lyngbya aestuarii BL J]|uniref:Uncharacterized protein n=1 Tax=Lyngbya aestuarii BL J TaxID=1348334 RepID=U7QCB7_9CYAN|nr:hypothetical protein M595_5197 [Lyngbya aestuarii BL J]
MVYNQLINLLIHSLKVKVGFDRLFLSEDRGNGVNFLKVYS